MSNEDGWQEKPRQNVQQQRKRPETEVNLCNENPWKFSGLLHCTVTINVDVLRDFSRPALLLPSAEQKRYISVHLNPQDRALGTSQ